MGVVVDKTIFVLAMILEDEGIRPFFSGLRYSSSLSIPCFYYSSEYRIVDSIGCNICHFGIDVDIFLLIIFKELFTANS